MRRVGYKPGQKEDIMKSIKTRVLYAYLNGNLMHRIDTVAEALKCNMMARDLEQLFILQNPELTVEIKVEVF